MIEREDIVRRYGLLTVGGNSRQDILCSFILAPENISKRKSQGAASKKALEADGFSR